MKDNRKFNIDDMQNNYDSGYLDALKWNIRTPLCGQL